MRLALLPIATLSLSAFLFCSFSLGQSSSKSAGQEKPLLLQFPADKSYGVIVDLPANWDIDTKRLSGTKFAQAQGKIELPLHHWFMFEPNYNFIEHPEVLNGAPANAFATVLLDRIEAEDRVMPYIYKLTGLRRLELLDTELTDKGLQGLGALVNLQFLSLHEGPYRGSFLAHITTPMKKLRDLRMDACTPETENLARYSSLLPSLKIIHFAGCHLKDEDLRFLRKFPYLEELHIDRNKQISDQGLKNLLLCKEIGFVNLNETMVTANGIKQLAALKLNSVMVPKRFSKREVEEVMKSLKNTRIRTETPIGSDAYQLFAPLH